MGHFAKVVDGLVVAVVAADQRWIDEQADKNSWLETSYNMRGGVYYDPNTGQPHVNQDIILESEGRKRKNYAGIGCFYDQKRNAFIPPTPYPSWLLNEDTCLWEAPIPYPQDGKKYMWNEMQQKWTNINLN